MTPSVDSTIKQICSSIKAADSLCLQQTIETWATYCFQDSSDQKFEQRLFEAIVKWMDQKEFLRMKGSYHLLMLFEYDWGLLTSKQKSALLRLIEDAYASFDDWMACFVLSELLGKYYANESAFQILCKLSASTKVAHRSLVPMGFEHLARNAKNEGLSNRAIAELKKLEADPCAEVKHETGDSLGRLFKQGIVNRSSEAKHDDNQ